MNFLKYLILGIFFAMLPACSTLGEEETWSKGDKVSSFFICKTEGDIMAVALADSKDRHLLRQSIFKKTITQDCLNLNPPLSFIVKEVIGSYIDHNNIKTSILSISFPNKEDTTVYIIAAGSPVSFKNNSF